MPSSKTDTAVRYPEDADQRRRLRNVTQDRKAVDRMQAEARSGQRKTEDLTNWGTEQLLDINMGDQGNLNPDLRVSSNGVKDRKAKPSDIDMHGAMNEDFD